MGAYRTLRSVAREWQFALFAGVSVAIAGALVAVALVLTQSLRREAPVRDARRLVMLAVENRDGTIEKLSLAQFDVIERQVHTLTDGMAYSLRPVEGDGGRPVLVALVSERLAALASEAGGRLDGALVSPGLRDTLLDADWIRLNDQLFPIAGVARVAALPFEPARHVAVWLPLNDQARLSNAGRAIGVNSSMKWLTVAAWLQPGVTPEAASEQVTRALRESGVLGLEQGVTVRSGRFGNPWRPTVPAALVAAMWVLTVILAAAVAVNLATLGLVRSAQYERQVAIRLALGAKPVRLFMQSAVEWLLIALPGGLMGGLLGAMILRWPLTILIATDGVSVPWNVTGFAATMAAATALGVPVVIRRARRVAKLTVADVLLREDQRAGGGTSLSRFSWVLAAHFGIAAFVLSMGLQLVTTIARLTTTPLGLKPEHAYVATVNIRGSGDGNGVADVARLFEAAAGVRVAAAVEHVPLGDSVSSQTVYRGNRRSADRLQSNVSSATANAMSVLGTKVVHGRDFDHSDHAGSARVALVNATVARRLWRDENPIGDTVVVRGAIHEVVGVFEDGRYVSPVEPNLPLVYVSMVQQAQIRSAHLIVRTEPAGDSGMTEFLEEFSRSLPANGYAVGRFTPLQEVVNRWLLPIRTLAVSIAAIAIFLTTLVAHGVFSVVGVALGAGRHDVAVRRALGATRTHLVRMMLGRVLRKGFPAAVVGAGLGALASRVLGYVPLGTPPHTVGVFVAASVVVGGCAALTTILAGLMFCGRDDQLARELA